MDVWGIAVRFSDGDSNLALLWSFQYDSWVHPTVCSMGIEGFFPWWKGNWGTKLITHHHSESRIRMNAAILALCNMSSWHAHGCCSLYRSVENCTPHLNWYIFQICYLWFQIPLSFTFTYCWPKCTVPKLHAIHWTRFNIFCMSFNIQCIKQCSK
jgi:hypothetical protein